MGEVASNQSEEIRRILLNRHLDNVFHGSGAPKRPGSAPPQAEVLPSSPLGTAPIGYNYITGEPLRGVGGGQQHGPPPPPTQHKFTENVEIGITPDSEEALRSRPEYVAYYYAHVRNNPRLPPPLATRNLSPTWPENGKSFTSDGLLDTQAKPDASDAESQATMNMLFGSHLTLKDGAEPIPIRGTNYLGQNLGPQVTSSLGAPSAISPSQCPDTLASAWANVGASAAASSAARQLDALLGAFGSPKPSANRNPLLTAELKAQASGVSLYSNRSVDEQALESLYAGSTPHTPLGSQHGGAAQLFNTFNADSPRPSSLDVIGRSVSSSSLGGAVLGKDPKINPAPGPAGRLASVIGDQRATLRTPSKLRIGTSVVDPDPQQQLLDSFTGADSSAAAAAAAAVAAAAADPDGTASALASVAQVQAAVEALQNLPPGAASAFAAALSGSDQAAGGQPLVTPDVLLGGAGTQQQQQMQAMYMAAAAMYPVYYAQQAQQAAGVQHSIQAMQAAAMTGFPAVSSGGFPVMPASVTPAMLQAAYPTAMIPGLPSGAAATLLGSGSAGLPGVMPEVAALAAAGLRPPQPYATMNAGAHLAPSAFPPSMVVGATGGDYAAYYHKILEAQAAAVAIAGNGKDVLGGSVPPPPPPHGQPPPPPKDNRRNSGGEVAIGSASVGTYGHPLSATEGDRRLRATSAGPREMERMLSSRGSGNLGSSNGASVVGNIGGSPGVLNGSPSQTSHSSYSGVSPQQSQHQIHHHQANNSRLRSGSGSQTFLDSHVAAASGASAPLASVSSGGPGGYSPRESRGQLEIPIQRRNSRRDALAGPGACAVEAEGGHQASPGSARGPRSSGDTLLDEFKSNKTGRKYELREILGHVYEFSLDQHGSRFIQQKLESIALEDLDAAFAEVLPRILHLVTDVFGNYVVQKFLEHGTLEHRGRLAKALHGHVLQLSLQMYGCRVVQKALEVFTEEQQVELVAELDGHIMRCVRDQNGNHVIQKCIECVPTPRIVGLLDNFLMCVVPLSTHPFGCRIIQRILEHVRDARRRAAVMADILAAAVQLTQDQYGNYVIQHVLERGTAEERSSIASSLAPTVVQLSMHKFASNVIEKCLTYGSTADRDLLINRMLGAAALQMQAAAAAAGTEGDMEVEDPVQAMMKDQFGNYVVQKVLEVCTDEQREIMLARVRQQLHALKRFTYGKHIVARVEKLLSAGTRYQTHAKGRLLPDDEALAAAAAAGRLALGTASHSSSGAAPRSVEVPSAGIGYAANTNETATAAGGAPDAPTTPPVSSSPSDSCYTGALAASTSTALPVHADSEVSRVDGEIRSGVAVA